MEDERKKYVRNQDRSTVIACSVAGGLQSESAGDIRRPIMIFCTTEGSRVSGLLPPQLPLEMMAEWVLVNDASALTMSSVQYHCKRHLCERCSDLSRQIDLFRN